MCENYEEIERITIEENMRILNKYCLYIAIGSVVINSHGGNRYKIIELRYYEDESLGDKKVYLLESLNEWDFGNQFELDTCEIDGIWWYIEGSEPKFSENKKFAF